MTFGQADAIQKIVIAGGGTAGWMTAAALANALGKTCEIHLVESAEIGTVGVGEATIPHIQLFNEMLGVDEDEFMRKTQATFKLGIDFVNWKQKGHRYVHPFGSYGEDIAAVPFHHYWLKLSQAGIAPALEEFSITIQAAYANKFMRPVDIPDSPLSAFNYAFQFDAGLYAAFLRDYAGQRGVQRFEGKIAQVKLRAHDGFIESLALENGQLMSADLFIDCTGFRGLLIEQALNTGYDDWSQWLPCDRAIAVPCANADVLTPYTRATAHTAGWQWRIPLQHRIGNGHVYSSRFMSDDEACAILMKNLDGEAMAEPKQLRFKAGKRKKMWVKNCVAIGLASGFMEPLESTSIHLIQTAIARLISLFPSRAFHQREIDFYNQHGAYEYERIRDFLILHYKATERNDSPFWDHCRNMEIPQYLQDKIDLYQNSGRIYRENDELFGVTSWLAVFEGQGIKARAYHPMVDKLATGEIQARVADYQKVLRKCTSLMPAHIDYIQQHCRSF
ncbi:MAG: tryptophan 7-halogenase [Gammaproteobacteria bacterium]|nr:MAG: tryptophan 7-halogenase [Gammaproteobacteria bacterium]